MPISIKVGKRQDFSLDFGEDGSGLLIKYLRRGSGYYIDVKGYDFVTSTADAWQGNRS